MGKGDKKAQGDGKGLQSRWGGSISMKGLFKDGKLRYYAVCQKTGNKARRPRDLM